MRFYYKDRIKMKINMIYIYNSLKEYLDAATTLSGFKNKTKEQIDNKLKSNLCKIS
jgi:hypothetical protein